jgi:endoglucanase
MKRLNLFLSLMMACLLITACQNSKQQTGVKSFPFSFFRLHKGTNIGHWLSQSRARGETRKSFFTEKDVKFIDSVGFDHIRLPIDEEQMWDENEKRHDEAFGLMEDCLEWAREAGLRVVIDLHILRSHYFNAEEKPLWTKPEEQDKFIRLWKDLSDCLHVWPNGMVAYELMNEPVADDPEQWNMLINRAVDSIRKWEPQRVIVIGSNMWQKSETFDRLRVPANDTNLVLSFHFYDPMPLTHYQAGWTEFRDFTGKVNYPGQLVLDSKDPRFTKVYNRDTLLKMMQKPIHLSDSLKLPLYCGEFGVYRDFFPEAKLAWYRDMVSIFNEFGIAYANWNYKSDAFGIVDENMRPQTEIIKILTGK